MNPDLTRQFELGRAPQRLAQNFFLDLKLMFVGCVLVVTSSALAEVWTGRLGALCGRRDHRLGMSARETRFLLGQSGFDFFSGQHERHEHCLSAAMLIGR